jgi:hypothetical protein
MKAYEAGYASRLLATSHAGSSLADFYTLKLETIHSSETSIHTRSTRRHIPEDGVLHSHRYENLKSYISERYFLEGRKIWHFLSEKQILEEVRRTKNKLFKPLK